MLETIGYPMNPTLANIRAKPIIPWLSWFLLMSRGTPNPNTSNKMYVRKPTPRSGRMSVRSGSSSPITDESTSSGQVISTTMLDSFLSNLSPI